MKVFITGVAGLYGIHTVEEIKKNIKVEKIYGIDDFSRGFPSEQYIFAHQWGGNVEIKKQRFQDLTVKELDYLAIDVFIHLAGYNSSKESMNTPEEYFLNNEYGTFQIMQKLLRTKKRPHLIFASTTEVYGPTVGEILNKNQAKNPQNVHAVTKLAAENHLIAQKIWNKYPITILRFTSTYGENQNIYGFKSVISAFIDRALRNEPLIIYGAGNQKRDFLYVKDAAKAIALAISNKEKVEGLSLNIGTGKVTSIIELAEIIKKITGSSSEIINLPADKGELSGAPVDLKYAKEVLGWQPQYSLDDGLKRTVNWYKCLQSI